MGLGQSNQYLTPSNLFENQYYQKALQSEINILNQSGLKVGEQIKIQDVPIDEEVIIHSYKINNGDTQTIADGKQQQQFETQKIVNRAQKTQNVQKKQKIVLIHGYMSSQASYFKMLEQLSQNFEVYAIDLPGMALSSRPNYNQIQSHQQNVDFFVNSIDQFMHKQNIDKFTLVGHSFGGYIGSMYALKFPHKIESLHLLSPLGVTARNQQELQDIQKEIDENYSVFSFRQNVFNYVKNAYKNGDTLQTIANKSFIPTDWFVKRWMKYWFPKESNLKERQFFTDYVSNILKLPTSSDQALNNMFHLQKLSAKVPLETALIYSPINTYFYFGDRDWMCKIGAERMRMVNAEKQLHIVKDAGHNIQIDQPQFLVDQILKTSNK